MTVSLPSAPPNGWTTATVGELLDRIEAGRSFQALTRPAGPTEWGVVKVSSMTLGTFRAEEKKALPPGAAFDERWEIRAGDVLFSRANTVEYVGAVARVGAVRRRLLLSDKSLRLVPGDSVDPAWLTYILAAPTSRTQLEAAASGTKESMRNISQEKLRSVRLHVPPLLEQRRLVEEIERRLSHVAAGLDSALRAQRMLTGARAAILMEAVPTTKPGWRTVTVADAGVAILGKQRSPKNHHGDNMKPYLRVANVFEDRIDLADVMQMHFTPAETERFRLVPGDILLNEGQSPQYLGRPAMYTGEPAEMYFTNSLIRFRAGDGVLPEWALLVFRRHMHAGRFQLESRVTTNIAHLGLTRLQGVEFPIPPVDEQKARLSEAHRRLSLASTANDACLRTVQRAARLRAAILHAAATGSLLGADNAGSSASTPTALLETA